MLIYPILGVLAIGNPVMWLVACLVGSVVGCLILSLWKKPLKSE